MSGGEHDDVVVIQEVRKVVREAPDRMPSHRERFTSRDQTPDARRASDPFDCDVDLIDERHTKSGALPLVPSSNVVDFVLCLRCETNGTRHSTSRDSTRCFTIDHDVNDD